MYIALDIGGTNTRIAGFETLDPKSETGYTSFNTSEDYQTGVKNILNSLDQFVSGRAIEGIGISIALIFDSKNKIIFRTNLFDWQISGLVDILRQRYHTDVFAINDASAGALAEMISMRDKKRDRVVYFTWGTGFGGVTIEKKENNYTIYEYEPGHWTLIDEGRKCVCGRKGCLQTYVGGKEIEKVYRKKAADLEEKEWDEILDFASTGIVNILKEYPVNTVIFHGMVVIANPKFISILEEKVNKITGKNITFEKASIGDKSPLYGALLALDKDITVKIEDNIQRLKT